MANAIDTNLMMKHLTINLPNDDFISFIIFNEQFSLGLLLILNEFFFSVRICKVLNCLNVKQSGRKELLSAIEN